jgi:hypothetical protein
VPTIIAVLLMCLVTFPTHVFAAGPSLGELTSVDVEPRMAPTRGLLMHATIDEANRLANRDAIALPAQAAGPRRSGPAGHPVLIGTLIGAAAGAALFAAATSCSVPDAETRASGLARGACGSHPRVGAALLGAGVGAGVGALIGLIFRD